MADALLGASAYETRLLVQRGIMQRTGCALAGPPLLARATLTLPLKSVPAALFTSLVLPSFSFPLNCTQNSVLHSAIKSFLGKSLSAQKSVGKGHSLTHKNIKEKTSASMYLYVWTVFPWLFLVLYLFFVFVDV